MILIGISGKKKSGKDTLCTSIKLHTRYSVRRVGFADGLKHEVCAALKITREELERDKDLYRVLLQWWGTEYRRNKFGEDYWVIQTAREIIAAGNQNIDIVIVPDVRFKNEYDCIKNAGGIMVKVTRDGLPEDNHASETQLDKFQFDYTFNNTTVDSCHQFAKTLLSRIATH